MPNARENALNIASISWCVLPPRIKSICVVNLALITTALKNSSTNSVSNVPTFSLLNVALKDKYGRGAHLYPQRHVLMFHPLKCTSFHNERNAFYL